MNKTIISQVRSKKNIQIDLKKKYVSRRLETIKL